MQKVYALIGGCIDDKHVVAIFSSMKRANEAKAWLIKNDTFYRQEPNELEVETYELNGERID